MIKKLTKQQNTMLSVYRDKWLDIGLSTESIDFELCKSAIIKCYTTVKLEAPTQFFYARSPKEAYDIYNDIDKSGDKNTFLESLICGNQDASWLSFYDYFNREVDKNLAIDILPMVEYANIGGWANVFDDVVILHDRPEVIKFDDRNLLHCEDGPAICYLDGYSVFAWHGVRIPAEWITHKASLAPETALNWENVEQRRCACEIIGWATILRKLNASVIDCDDDPMIGTLVEVTIPDIGREKFLKVICGTGREFALPVPPEMKTALEANAWTYGLDGDMLRQLEVRT